MCSGSVKHFQTRSRGASSTREITKSALFVAVEVIVALTAGFLRLHRPRNDHHPADTEFVGDHAEALGEEGRSERHLHIAARGERVEQLAGFGLVLRRDRKREALEVRL